MCSDHLEEELETDVIEFFHAMSIDTARIGGAYGIHLSYGECEYPVWEEFVNAIMNASGCRIRVPTSPCGDDPSRKTLIVSRTQSDMISFEEFGESAIGNTIRRIDRTLPRLPEEESFIDRRRDHFSSTEKRESSEREIILLGRCRSSRMEKFLYRAFVGSKKPI